MNKRPIRMVVLLISLLLIVMAFPWTQAGAQVDSTIRVLLKRLKVGDSLHIAVQGTYMLSDGSMTFADGTEMVIALRDDQLVLHANGLAIVLGPSAVLRRCEGEKSASLLLAGNDGLYEGDLHLSVMDGAIRPVLHIFIEDYLMGVVPY